MVKAPSKHGLDRKFKPWRKGKSQKAKKQGSLKHQLRGQERLLQKVQKQPESEANQTKIQELEASIKWLKEQIAAKEKQEQERQNAKESHGTRFLERQRLTRLERNARKQNDTKELKKIAMDQVYVAHYPLLKKYKPLFRNGVRYLHNAVSRANIRQKIVKDLHENTVERVPWISKKQYDLVPSEWSLEIEKSFFGYPTKDEVLKQKSATEDDRFAMKSKHEALLEAADQLESKLSKEEEQAQNDSGEQGNSKVVSHKRKNDAEQSDSDSESSDSSDDDDDAGTDPLVWNKTTNKEGKQEKDNNDPGQNKKDSDSDDSSDDDSSSDSSSDGSVSLDEDEKKTNKQILTTPAKSSTKGATSFQENNEEHDHSNLNEDDSDDDFLVAAKEDDIQVFDAIQNNRKHMLPAENPAKGDKSQGWATQQQRPGKFKKKRVRR